MIADRFQEYSPDFKQGETTSDLVPINTIDKVPIAMFTVANDAICSAKEIAEPMK